MTADPPPGSAQSALVADVAVDPAWVEQVEAAYRAHATMLRRLAMTVLGDADLADETVQEAFVALQRNDDVDDPRAWLITVTLNRCRSWQRRLITARRYRPLLVECGSTAAPDANAVAVRAALGRLGPSTRAVLFLRFYLDLPHDEIARLVGCRPGTVKSRVSRGLAQLKEALDD